jgi:hypothetical protein
MRLIAQERSLTKATLHMESGRMYINTYFRETGFEVKEPPAV